MSWFADLLNRWTLKRVYKWGKGIAKTKLLVFNTLHEAHPEMSREELYYLTLLNRTGYTETSARSIVNVTKELAEGRINVHGPPGIENRVMQFDFFKQDLDFNLQTVVKNMLTHECTKRGTMLNDFSMLEAMRAVEDVIPDNL